MGALTPETLEVIRRANREIRGFLSTVPAGTTSTLLDGFPALAEAITEAGHRLAGAALDANLEPSARAELTEYAENLRRLREALAKLQTDLTGLRSELQSRVARGQATLAWVDSLKQTVEHR